jgi:hypothetical protein
MCLVRTPFRLSRLQGLGGNILVVFVECVQALVFFTGHHQIYSRLFHLHLRRDKAVAEINEALKLHNRTVRLHLFPVGARLQRRYNDAAGVGFPIGMEQFWSLRNAPARRCIRVA